jgi:hypothetical protein
MNMSPLASPLDGSLGSYIFEKPVNLLKGIEELEKKIPSTHKLFASIKSAATSIHTHNKSCCIAKFLQSIVNWVVRALNTPPCIEDLALQCRQLRQEIGEIAEHVMMQPEHRSPDFQDIFEAIEICQRILESYEYIASNYHDNPYLRDIYIAHIQDPEVLVRRVQIDKHYNELDEWQAIKVNGQLLYSEEEWDFIHTSGKKTLELMRNKGLDANCDLVKKFDPNRPQLFEFLCYYVGLANEEPDPLQGLTLETVVNRFNQVEKLYTLIDVQIKDFIFIKKFLNYDLFKLSELSNSSLDKPFKGIHEEVFNQTWHIFQYANEADKQMVIDKIQDIAFKIHQRIPPSLEDFLNTLKEMSTKYQFERIPKPQFLHSFSCWERRR